MLWKLPLGSIIAALCLSCGASTPLARLDGYGVLAASEDPDPIPEQIKLWADFWVGPVPGSLSVEVDISPLGHVRVLTCLLAAGVQVCAECTTGKTGACEWPGVGQ